MNITAAVARKKGEPLVFEELQIEDPREDEILVRVVGCGVCHTDLAIREQYYPTPFPVVLGHEGSGVVEKIGSRVTSVKPGDHVIMSFLTCGECDACISGRYVMCPEYFNCNFSGRRKDGTSPLKKGDEVINGCFFSQSTFANYALATERNTLKVSKDLPLEILGPLGCGIQTGAGASINSLGVRPGSSLATFGCGTVGLSAIMGAHVCGCTKNIAVDISDERLELARQFGATHGINSKKTDPIKAIQKITGKGGADYSLECIGLPQVVRQAVDCLRTPGLCGLIGASPMGTETRIDMNNMLFGRTLRGINEGDSIPQLFIPILLELHEQGRFPFDKLITMYDFKDINQAFDDIESGKVLKAVVKM
jgi:Zn-dependent alcohol dehydrogenases, class III